MPSAGRPAAARPELWTSLDYSYMISVVQIHLPSKYLSEPIDVSHDHPHYAPFTPIALDHIYVNILHDVLYLDCACAHR